mmetsp:Transcript_29862/g.55839  ORF Transcript_29862/g.55839 Transcript_29862/m.55839 type:complete len:301 (-) Transcript_29862:282-1184(-)
MSERKVVNKYFPPDFDPAVLPKRANRRPPATTRVVLPAAVQCQACFGYMYRGTRVNATRKEGCGPLESHPGIRKFRFYFRCRSCVAEMCVQPGPLADHTIQPCGSLREKYAEMGSGEAKTLLLHETRTKAVKRDVDVSVAHHETQDLSNSSSAKIATAEILAKGRHAEEEANEAELAKVAELNRTRKGGRGIKRQEDSGTSSDSEARRTKRSKNSIFAMNEMKEPEGKKKGDEETQLSSGSGSKLAPVAVKQDAAAAPVPVVAASVAKAKKEYKKRKLETAVDETVSLGDTFGFNACTMA